MLTPSQFWRDPRMPYVETRRACESRICYQAHSHPTLSIGAVDQGMSRFQTQQTGLQIIHPSTLVIVPAHVVHSCNPMEEMPWSYQMMHLDAVWLTVLLDEYHIEYPAAHLQRTTQLQAQVIYDVRLHQRFTQLNDLLFNPKVSILEKEHQLIEGLIEILLAGLPQATHANLDGNISRLEALIDELAQCDYFVPLQDMAERLAISRFSLIRLFKHHFGLSPHAYQMNLRVNQARELLKSGMALADVAFALGFCDQSHFHRCFKAYTGVTPKQYCLTI